jgi:hypothetical protein
MAIDLTQVAAGLTTLRAAAVSTGPLAQASFADLVALTQSLKAGSATVGLAVEAAEAVLGASFTMPGGGDAVSMVAEFLAVQSVADQMPELFDLSAFLDRMQMNLAQEIVQDHGGWAGVLVPVPQ